MNLETRFKRERAELLADLDLVHALVVRDGGLKLKWLAGLHDRLGRPRLRA